MKKNIKEFSKIKDFIIQNLIPNIYVIVLNNKLRKMIKELNQKDQLFEIKSKKNLDELINVLKSIYDRELNRKKIVEDKAKSSLFIISLTISFTLGSLGFLNSIGLISEVYILILLIIGLIYLILSGINCISVLGIAGYYDIHPNNQIIESENQLILNNFKKEEIANHLYTINKLNKLLVQIKTNFAYSTFIGIRNGMIFLTIFFITIILNIILKN